VNGDTLNGVGWTGRRLPRREDRRLLTGSCRYLDDHIARAGRDVRHAEIVRSPLAHGTLRGLDTTSVVTPVDLVLTPDDVIGRVGAIPILWHLPGQFQHDYPVVDAHLRFIGQPVGALVAATRGEARDAIEQVTVIADSLSPVVDARVALGDDAPLLYPETGTNVMAAWYKGDDNAHTDAVFAAADHVITVPMRIGRLAGAPLEPRGVLVDPDRDGKLTVFTSTQAPHAVRDAISSVTGLSLASIRVIAPDVGGAFGVKDHLEADEALVVLAAMRLERPVAWVEDRWQSLVTTAQARDEHYDVSIAFDDDGTLRGLRIEVVRNAGAHFVIFGAGPTFSMSGMVPAPYRWDAVRVEATVVATNTTPTGAYRGFGQTQAVFVRERAIDLAADALGIDHFEIRRRNLPSSDELPLGMRTSPILLDSGDYLAALDRARELVETWDPPPNDGRSRGVGCALYVQKAGVGPSAGNRTSGLDIGGYETAVLRMEPDSAVRAVVGVSPHGQGHETTFSQLIADRLGLDPDNVHMVFSDTDVTPYSGYGTAASRSIAVGGGATVLAAERLATRIRTIAAEMLEAAPDDVVLHKGQATVVGTAIGVPIADVARRAWQGWLLPEGIPAGLEERAVYDPEQFTFAYSVHVCRVAVDRDTGAVEVERYDVVHDCGTMVNPMIVEGQIHGGIAQGLGAALLEEAIFDAEGEPRATNFTDYLVPSADCLPMVEVQHLVHPSPYTPGGMKGMGEGGTNGAFACVANAVASALPEVARDVCTTPITPERIWQALRRVRS
jgi:carbon-monoxide dehydrogenase large subunit